MYTTREYKDTSWFERTDLGPWAPWIYLPESSRTIHIARYWDTVTNLMATACGFQFARSAGRLMRGAERARFCPACRQIAEFRGL